MNTIIKSTLAFAGFLAAVFAPLTAGADTFAFSGKGAYGEMSGLNVNGNMGLHIYASENTAQGKSNKSSSSGASVDGYYYTGTECWYGYGSTDTIQFNSIGSLPKQVIASGAVPVTWYEYCSGFYPYVANTVTFKENLTAVRDQASSNWGTNHYEYGNIKVNSHFDYSSAPAAVNAFSISS